MVAKNVFVRKNKKLKEDWQRGEEALEIAVLSSGGILEWKDWRIRKFSLTVQALENFWTFTISISPEGAIYGGQLWIVRAEGCLADRIRYIAWFGSVIASRIVKNVLPLDLKHEKERVENAGVDVVCRAKLDELKKAFDLLAQNNPELLKAFLRYADATPAEHNSLHYAVTKFS